MLNSVVKLTILDVCGGAGYACDHCFPGIFTKFFGEQPDVSAWQIF